MGRRTLLLLASILVAAAGTALIWVYVQNADARAQADWKQTVTVLQAVSTIDAGSGPSVVAAATKKVQVPGELVPARAISDASQLVGRAATVPILPGEFILLGQFDALGSPTGVKDNRVAVTVTLGDPNRVAGLLRPDMNVAVYAVVTGQSGGTTGGQAAGGQAAGGQAAGSQAAGGQGKGATVVQVLERKIRVLAIGNTTTVRNPEGKPAQIGTQSGIAAADVTLEADSKQAKRLILAMNTGQLWFTLLNGDGSMPPPDDSISSDQLLDSQKGQG